MFRDSLIPEAAGVRVPCPPDDPVPVRLFLVLLRAPRGRGRATGSLGTRTAPGALWGRTQLTLLWGRARLPVLSEEDRPLSAPPSALLSSYLRVGYRR